MTRKHLSTAGIIVKDKTSFLSEQNERIRACERVNQASPPLKHTCGSRTRRSLENVGPTSGSGNIMSVSIIKSTMLILNQHQSKEPLPVSLLQKSADAAEGPAGYGVIGFCIHSEIL